MLERLKVGASLDGPRHSLLGLSPRNSDTELLLAAALRHVVEQSSGSSERCLEKAQTCADSASCK